MRNFFPLENMQIQCGCYFEGLEMLCSFFKFTPNRIARITLFDESEVVRIDIISSESLRCERFRKILFFSIFLGRSNKKLEIHFRNLRTHLHVQFEITNEPGCIDISKVEKEFCMNIRIFCALFFLDQICAKG